MTSREAVQEFISQRTLALVGVSRGGKKFGNSVLKELTAKGYTVFPVHPSADAIAGVRCWPSLRTLPEPVGGVVIVVPPAETEKVVRDAVAAGIRRIWIQQGAQSEAAVRFCADNKLPAVTKQCILMYVEPVTSIHAFHRWVKKLFGGLDAIGEKIRLNGSGNSSTTSTGSAGSSSSSTSNKDSSGPSSGSNERKRIFDGMERR